MKQCKFYMCGGETFKTNCEVPLGIGYLMSNCNHRDWEFSYTENESELYDADMIALSSCANGAGEAIRISKIAKCPVIIGGQITLWNELASYNFTHIIKGEGELALDKILQGGSPKMCEEKMIDNIDIIKFPYRGDARSHQAIIITSRGCPYDCAFCSSQEYWDKVRYHSADYFIDEVKMIAKNYPQVTELDIADDLFASHKTRLREIHDKWLSNNLQKRFSLPKCFIRSNIFDDEICVLLQEMGFKNARFGGESASNRVLKILNKKATVENHINAIEVCQRHNMKVSASFMFGIPGETEEDVKITDDFIEKYTGILGNGGRYIFRAFPGTKFYDGEDISRLDMGVRF